MLYNYPSADMRSQKGGEVTYPRAADEMNCVKQELGDIAFLMNIVEGSKTQSFVVSDPLDVKPVDENAGEGGEGPSKQSGDGEEDAPQDDPQEGEDGENKKAQGFNPDNFTWTVSNGNPKNLSQVYYKSANCFKSVIFPPPPHP